MTPLPPADATSRPAVAVGLRFRPRDIKWCVAAFGVSPLASGAGHLVSVLSGDTTHPLAMWLHLLALVAGLGMVFLGMMALVHAGNDASARHPGERVVGVISPVHVLVLVVMATSYVASLSLFSSDGGNPASKALREGIGMGLPMAILGVALLVVTRAQINKLGASRDQVDPVPKRRSRSRSDA